MKLTPTKMPLVVKKLFPDYIWELPTHSKELYLTFDDGPTPNVTNWVLDTLKSFHAKATFFCIGDNVMKYPELFHQIMEEGHAIGNHTHNHIKGWKTKTKAYLENVLQADEMFKFKIQDSRFKIQDSRFKIQDSKFEIRNSKFEIRQSSVVNLFRPPYGQIKPKQGKQLMALGYRIVMWDVLSFDWDKRVSNQECLDHVVSNSKNGSIIVFHDSIKASNNMKFALPKVLEYFTEKGVSFKAIVLPRL